MNFKRLYSSSVKIWFLMFLAIVILLPSGSLLNINIKYIVAVLLFVNIIVFIKLYSQIREDLVIFSCVSSFFLATILIFFINGLIIHHNQYAVREFLDIISAFSVLVFIFFANKYKIVDLKEIIDLSFWLAIFYSIVKIAIFLSVYLGILEYSYVIEKMNSYLGIETVQYDYGNNIGRIQVSNDTLLSYILFFKIFNYSNTKWKLTEVIGMAAIIFAIFISFARYYWLSGLFAVLIPASFDYFRGRQILKKILLSLAITPMIIFGIIYLYGVPAFRYLIDERISGSSTQYSDTIRQQQIYHLKKEYERNMFFGNGLGGSVDGYLRSKDTPYAYEVQWLAYLMKLGIFGVFCLLCFLIVPFLTSGRFNSKKIQLLLMYGVWLISGFFNPNLASSAGGLVFGLFFLLSFDDSGNASQIGEPYTERSSSYDLGTSIESYSEIRE